MSRRALQLVNGLVALATLVLGSMQLALGVESPLYAHAGLPALPILDSNLRFFGGMGLALALAMLWALPSIERHATIVRIFWLCAVVGGVGRLVSAALVGSPSGLLVGVTILEVIGAPLIVHWHQRVAMAARRDSRGARP